MKLLRSTTVYGLSNVLERAIPFLLLPLLTRYLSAADFGKVAVFAAVVRIATPLVGLNTPSALRRRFFSVDDRALRSYLAGCILLLLGGLCSAASVTLLFGDALAALSELPEGWLLIALLQAAGQVLILLPLTLFQVEHRAKTYALIQIGRSAATALLTVLLVVVLGYAWRGALAALASTTLLSCLLVAVPVLVRRAAPHVERPALFHAFRYGASLIPHTLGALAVTTADRFFVTHYGGSAETGRYFVGYQIGFVISLAADAFTRAFSPWLFAGLEEGDPAVLRRIVRAIYGFFGAILAASLVISLLGPAIVRGLLAPEFAGAERYVAWIAVGFAFNGMYRVVAGFAFFAERTFALSAISVTTALLNLALNGLLVPRWGAVGAAQATAASFLVGFLLTFALARRTRTMPWRLGLGRA